MTDYISEREFLDYISSPSETGDPNVIAAIAATTAAIDQHCGRNFQLATSTSVRYYTPCNADEYYVLPVDDIASTDGLVVAVNNNNGSTYTQLELDTDYILEPVNQERAGVAGWPYDSLRKINATRWPYRLAPYWRDTVQVTAIFGWAAVPDAVKQAAKILAALYYKLGGAPLGVAGFDQFGSVRVREVPQVATLLFPFVNYDNIGIA